MIRSRVTSVLARCTVRHPRQDGGGGGRVKEIAPPRLPSFPRRMPSSSTSWSRSNSRAMSNSQSECGSGGRFWLRGMALAARLPLSKPLEGAVRAGRRLFPLEAYGSAVGSASVTGTQHSSGWPAPATRPHPEKPRWFSGALASLHEQQNRRAGRPAGPILSRRLTLCRIRPKLVFHIFPVRIGLVQRWTPTCHWPRAPHRPGKQPRTRSDSHTHHEGKGNPLPRPL